MGFLPEELRRFHLVHANRHTTQQIVKPCALTCIILQVRNHAKQGHASYKLCTGTRLRKESCKYTMAARHGTEVFAGPLGSANGEKSPTHHKKHCASASALLVLVALLIFLLWVFCCAGDFVVLVVLLHWWFCCFGGFGCVGCFVALVILLGWRFCSAGYLVAM